ncbi:hypothetical protein GUJ93_ZPchr0002g23498 [Zizania palustris]|uniref:Uncharacterized protein n=1 Tax=Zizania palustris TaxID=103762 RepID=A0A8J5SNM2_ZIZPA|nr:hypothetical protein GUJ93_ZPchr0002g23498 [Zizania palustris]
MSERWQRRRVPGWTAVVIGMGGWRWPEAWAVAGGRRPVARHSGSGALVGGAGERRRRAARPTAGGQWYTVGVGRRGWHDEHRGGSGGAAGAGARIPGVRFPCTRAGGENLYW